MDRPEFTDHDMAWLLLVCRLFDIGVAAFGLVAIITGHLAGGAGVAAIGLAALTYTVITSTRGTTDRKPRSEEPSCTPR